MQLPDYLKNYTSDLADRMMPTVWTSAPSIAPMGGVWVLKDAEGKTVLRGPNNAPQNWVDLVIVGAAQAESRDYYAHGYTPGSTDPPDCWSLDGVRPDASVVSPASNYCAPCPYNQWGSGGGDGTSGAKACRSAKLLVVALHSDVIAAVANPERRPVLRLLRVRPTSYKSLAWCVNNTRALGTPPEAWIIRVTIDASPGYPTLTFENMRLLAENEFHVAESLIEEAIDTLPRPTNLASTSAPSQIDRPAPPQPRAPARSPVPQPPPAPPPVQPPAGHHHPHPGGDAQMVPAGVAQGYTPPPPAAPPPPAPAMAAPAVQEPLHGVPHAPVQPVPAQAQMVTPQPAKRGRRASQPPEPPEPPAADTNDAGQGNGSAEEPDVVYDVSEDYDSILTALRGVAKD